MRILLLTLIGLLLSAQSFSQAGAAEMSSKTESTASSPSVKAGTLLKTIAGDIDGTQTYDRVFDGVGGPFDLTCNRGSTDSGNNGSGYQVFPMSTDVAGAYEIETVLGTNPDTYLYLYCDPFDPLDPMANLVMLNDDSGASSLFASQINTDLNAYTQYQIVVAGWTSADLGTYDILIRGPANATITDSVAIVPTLGEWGVIVLMMLMMIVSVTAVSQEKKLAIA